MNQDGSVKAISGGVATITAEAVNGKKASFDLTVDGSRRVMNVRVTRSRKDDNNIGDEWNYINEINGENAGREYLVVVGETLTFHSKFSELDEKPDIGEASNTHIVTEDDILNGFAITMELIVTENGGPNNGKSACFIVTYTLTAK